MSAVKATFAAEFRMFDIASGPASELIYGVRQIVKRMEASEGSAPIVLQSHTKGYDGNWREIAKFYRSLREQYPDARFITASDYWSERDRYTVKSRRTVT